MSEPTRCLQAANTMQAETYTGVKLTVDVVVAQVKNLEIVKSAKLRRNRACEGPREGSVEVSRDRRWGLAVKKFAWWTVSWTAVEGFTLGLVFAPVPLCVLSVLRSEMFGNAGNVYRHLHWPA